MEKLNFKILSSLAKVFSDETPKDDPICALSALKNEKISFQIAVCADANRTVELNVESDFGTALKLYRVIEIDSCSGAYANQDDYTLRRGASQFPDLLIPFNGSANLSGGKWQSFWVEISSEDLLESGVHALSVTVAENGTTVGEGEIKIKIIDAVLDKQELIYTNWFHTDCLANYYKTEIFGEEYWRIVENYLKVAAEYGMNAVLTPLFTPPLDTKVGGERPTVQLVDVAVTEAGYRFDFQKLERWIEMCDRAGVKYLEMSHFFTQWGAKHAPKIVATVKGAKRKIFGWKTRASGKKYGAFLDAFAVELKKFIAKHGIADRCLFHVSDEPNKSFMRHYQKAAAIVKRNFGEFPIVDALSDFDFYKNGLIELPIPANDRIEPFIGNVPQLWTYYCCAQHKNFVSNRFFNMPSQRNRVLGFQMYKFGVKGFLHWGYNYWYTRFSVKEIDPYRVTDAGGAFSAGDSFVVYPAKDGTPLPSLRMKVFSEGLQDMRALQLSERLIGREKTLAIVEAEGEISFSRYPHSDVWLLKTRESVNRAIEEAVRKLKNN